MISRCRILFAVCSCALLCACSSMPRDSALTKMFSQSIEFERLRQMIDEDNLDGRIAADYADPRLPPMRLEKYRQAMAQIGVVRLWAHGRSKPFELIVGTSGFIHSGDYKGYLYDPEQEHPVSSSLDRSCFNEFPAVSEPQFCETFRKLGNGWWLIRYEYI